MRTLYGFVVAALIAGVIGCSGGGNSNPTQPNRPSAASNSNGPDTVATEDGSGSDEPISTEGWGNLKGRFIVTGAPAPNKITVSGDDVAYCGNFTLVDESVLAGPDGGLANVVLMLYTKRGDDPPQPHKQYAAAADSSVVMNNTMCRFVPRVTLLRTSQTLEIKNSDTVGHNTNIKSSERPINPLIQPNAAIDEKFKIAEREPAAASCNIHPWMKGWLVVRESPYMAVTNENGEFLIENLPAGKHTFQVWHEKGKFLTQVEIGGKETRWSGGRVEAIVKDGEATDLGEIRVSYESLTGG